MKRVFKDGENPLERYSQEVLRRFRIGPASVLFIVDLLTPAMEHPTTRNHSLPVLLQVIASRHN